LSILETVLWAVSEMERVLFLGFRLALLPFLLPFQVKGLHVKAMRKASLHAHFCLEICESQMQSQPISFRVGDRGIALFCPNAKHTFFNAALANNCKRAFVSSGSSPATIFKAFALVRCPVASSNKPAG
jgi:hypothetical protein